MTSVASLTLRFLLSTFGLLQLAIEPKQTMAD
jgi:hypothetical protein